MFGLNVDGASVNTGLHNGLDVLIREINPWLIVVHCFSHRFELAVRIHLKKLFFTEIETMILKIFHLYKKLHLAMYLDVLMPLKTLSLGLKKEEHDPVLILRRIHD